MADPGLAFDPNAPPPSMRSIFGVDDQGGRIAQAPLPQTPVQPPVVTPAPAPPVAPAAPVAPPETGAGALRTDLPAPPPGQSQQSLWGDPDQLELNEARREAARAYNDPNNVLSHSNGYVPIKDVTKPQDHPEYRDYRRLIDEVWPTLSKQERAARAPALRAMEKKIDNDLKASNLEVRKRHEEELKKADAKWEDAAERDKNAAVVGGHIDTFRQETEQWAQHKDPALRDKHDYVLKTSPLATMRRAKPDGTFDNTPLRDAANTIVMLNGGISNEQAINLTLGLGSPYGFDDKTGKPLPGYNGRTGAGAASYKVIGRDVRNNVVIEIEGGQKLRLPPETLARLAEARVKGYGEAKKWEAERKKQAEPGLVGRTFNWARDQMK